MGNCCSTASDKSGLIPNEHFDRDIITFDKEYDPKKPKKHIFKFSGTSISSFKSKKRSGASDKRNPATGQKNPSIADTPSPEHSEIDTNITKDVGFSNQAFEPSTPLKEPEPISHKSNDTGVIDDSNRNNVVDEIKDSKASDDNEVIEMNSAEYNAEMPEELDQHVTMRQHFPRDDTHNITNRPTSLPVGLPTLKEDSTDIIKSTISPIMSPGLRKTSVPTKVKPKRGYANLPLLEFKKFLLKETPSYENEYSPIVSDVLAIKGETYDFSLRDLKDVDGSKCLGSGGFGVVSKMKHNPSGCVMAVKRVQIRVDISLKRELAVMDEGRKKGSPFIVEYYGSIKHNGEVWIAMELMKESMDKIKIKVYDEKKQFIPEHIIKHVSYSICAALHFLKNELKIIHRDVKPSNMLVGEDGSVKICDFGISGPLIESRAKSKEVGCRPYMAPERLDPNTTNYTVQVDVWSFGISIMELMTGVFPYGLKISSYFEQWNEIVLGEPPQMEPNGRYSEDLLSFINPCTSKDSKDRPTLDSLLKHDFFYDYDLDTSKESTREWMEEMQI